MLPFTTEQFLRVFEVYNEAVWPMQPILFGLAVLAVGIVLKQRRSSDFLFGAILSGLWLWAGVAYHLLFFSAINPAAIGFGLLFVAQAVLLTYAGPVKRRLALRVCKDWQTALGAGVLLYALVIYPLLGHALGHEFPRAPTFGVPCPVTIYTFGLLLWTDTCLPRTLLVIPVLWAIIGSSAAVLLGIWEDLGLLAAAAAASLFILLRNHAAGNK